MERKQTEAERNYLEDLLGNLPTSARRFKEAVENFFVMLAATTLLSVLAWAGIAWSVSRLANREVGWSSDYAIPITLTLLAGSAMYSAYSTRRWMKRWKDYRQPVGEDVRAGIVTEERFSITEAKLFQEPEHGGLLYCMQSDDGRVLVFYDRESIDLAMAEEDPFGSSFEPRRSAVKIVKAPRSQVVVETSFGGGEIDIYGPFELTAPPEKWPENKTFCSIPWDDLEKELCA